MDRFSGGEQKPLTHPLVTRAIANAQKRVEENHFEIRKHLLEYDDVMNRQREVIYKMRDDILKGSNFEELLYKNFEDTVEDIILKYSDEKEPSEEWDWDGLIGEFNQLFLTNFFIEKEEKARIKQSELFEKLVEKAKVSFRLRKQNYDEETFNEMLKSILLLTIDNRWREHLYSLDALREGISLRAYAQKDPLVEYKQESFKMFDELLRDTARDVSGIVFRATPRPIQRKPVVMQEYKPGVDGKGITQPKSSAPAMTATKPAKVGRNDPCPCGSGKKYKKCCGRKVV